jgi:hypothetical protein
MRIATNALMMDEGGFWIEGVESWVEVEVTDADEIRIGVLLPGESVDVVTLHVSRADADKLARLLAAASVTDVVVPSPSVSAES